MIDRRTFYMVFSVAVALVGGVSAAHAQSALEAQVAKPVTLPDIAIGSPKAPVTSPNTPR